MASSLVTALDQSLSRAGQDIVLRRVVGNNPNAANVDVTVRAVVRSFAPEELIGGIKRTDRKVILSPTQIAERQWPGGEVAGQFAGTPSLPRQGDSVLIEGRLHRVEAVSPFLVAGELVRIELQVAG